MKIVFLALSGTFDFSQVGGTDSYMRRLVNGIIQQDQKIEAICCFYGADKCEQIEIKPQVKSIRVHSFHDALQYLSDLQPDSVIATYIHPRDRLTFARFRKRNKDIRFHNIVFFYPQGSLKRYVKFLEYSLYPYNGKLFCVSKRQHNALKTRTNGVIYLPPIIPDDYFVDISQKPENESLQVTFLGRLDPRKGFAETVELFNRLRHNKKLKCTIYGIHIRSDAESYLAHECLKNQNSIEYVEIGRQGYTPDLETMVKSVLKQTDLLVQPYKTLDSTVDTPLLLLEAMASLCAVLTTDTGDVSELYGPSRFVMDRDTFSDDATTLLDGLSVEDLHVERKRIMRMPILTEARTETIVKRFLQAIED